MSLNSSPAQGGCDKGAEFWELCDFEARHIFTTGEPHTVAGATPGASQRELATKNLHSRRDEKPVKLKLPHTRDPGGALPQIRIAIRTKIAVQVLLLLPFTQPPKLPGTSRTPESKSCTRCCERLSRCCCAWPNSFRAPGKILALWLRKSPTAWGLC